MKGQSSYPFTMLEAALSFMVLISVLYGGQGFILSFVKEETVDLRLDRVGTAAMTLETYPEGHISLEMENHEFRVDGDEIVLRFRDTEESQDILDKTDYARVVGPSDFSEIDILCLEKTGNNLQLSGGC